MPVKSKSKSKSSSAKAKSKAGAKAKMSAKPKAARKKLSPRRSEKDVMGAMSAASPKRGFMWKLLERKKEEQKKRSESRAFSSPDPVERLHSNASGFGRFAGPRRRAA